MNYIDWGVLFATLFFIVIYGVWKTRHQKNIDTYLKGGSSTRWWTIGMSIMATQASAVTFLSTTGQGMQDGLRFIQFYFGLPLAMIIISEKMVPLYYRLKVYTAYEYLESRFDAKTRSLSAFLFLTLRGMSSGITLFAPSIILSILFGWDLWMAISLIGGMSVIYTVTGGNRAVSITHQFQLTIMIGGMLLAGLIAMYKLPESVSFSEQVMLAGELGMLRAVSFDFSLDDRYNIWSGLLASLFLFLSYFGTDQSQVGRYLNGKSITESRMGLLMNGLLKIPMQFLILFIGVLLFIFYLFNSPPIYYNERLYGEWEKRNPSQALQLTSQFEQVQENKQHSVDDLLLGIRTDDDQLISKSKNDYTRIVGQESRLRQGLKDRLKKISSSEKTDDRDFRFLYFVLHHLPHGIIGLLMAVIFSAAMSSLSSELIALGSTTTVDFYKRWWVPSKTSLHYLHVSRLLTTLWSIGAVLFAFVVARQNENLIQYVNIIGSLFYGVILGIFLTGFFLKFVKGNAVFIAAVISECIVLGCYFYFQEEVAFLYYNVIGCAGVMGISSVCQVIIKQK